MIYNVPFYAKQQDKKITFLCNSALYKTLKNNDAFFCAVLHIQTLSQLGAAVHMGCMCMDDIVSSTYQ